MLTVLEILIIASIIPVIIWALLPVKQVPRVLDFMPAAGVIFLILHLFIDNEAVKIRFVPLYIFTITLFLVTLVRLFRHNPNQPKHRIPAGIGRIFALLALALCVIFPTVVLPFQSLPQPTGKYNLGTVVCDLTDNNREEAFTPESGDPRKIVVQFWYPAETDINSEYGVSNAPLAKTQDSYPVLIFSHGAFGVRNSNASACRELASHGYIVVSLDHTYHSFYTAFSDGSKVIVDTKFINDALNASSGKMDPKEEYPASHNWLNLRTADIEFVIDSLKSGDIGVAGELLSGHMDLTNIGLFGHSMGGAASAQVTRDRDEVKAAIVIDGTLLGDITGLDSNNNGIVTNKAFTKPLLQMYNGSFLNPEAKKTSYLPNINAYNNATAAAYSLCIKDSGHLNFTDLPRISPILSKMLGTGTVDPYECIKLVNGYSLAFFDKHLKGQPSELLDGSTATDKVIFDTRNRTK